MLKVIAPAQARITDPFFGGRIRTARESSIPYMYDALHDAVPGVAPSGCIANLEVAAGLRQGGFTGFVFQDSDLWKWVEGAAYALAAQPDAALERRVDELIDLAARAQQPDGYLDTYYIINGLDKRFTNLRDNHELYVAGHMCEAAAAYYEATGKRTLLDVACRFADCIDRTFGPGPEQKHGYPGHEEIELGLVALYRVTGTARYLKLAQYFLDARGQQPYYYDQEALARGEKLPEKRRNQWETYSYFQAQVPVRSQTAAVGHAVRQGYLLAGMAEVGGETGDESLTDAAERIFANIVNRQMYITGGVGATHEGEAFTFDYDLPPERCYTETCAAISLMMTAARLNRISPCARYGDIVERVLYNGMLAGVSLDGTKYFYMNPLEVWPERCEKRQDLHIHAERQGWFGCACCPPNVLRTLTGLSRYLFTVGENTLYVDQYVAADAEVRLDAGAMRFSLDARMPWQGDVQLTVLTDVARCGIAFRIPSWTDGWSMTVNGAAVAPEMRGGYAVVERAFRSGDCIRLALTMPVRRMRASMHTPNYAGKTAIMRGPLVYCLEEIDNGAELWNLELLPGEAKVEARPELLGGVQAICLPGRRTATGDALYSDEAPSAQEVELTFVPYYAWGNRGRGEMSVWVRQA